MRATMNGYTILGSTVLSLAVLTGCGAQPQPPAAPAAAPAAPAAKNADIKPIGEAKVGDTTLCPISKEEFVVAADSPKVEHEGKTYYFCCGGCAKKFQADPKKFLTPAS